MSQPKICPRCGASYDDSIAFCAKDGARLVRGGQSTDLIDTVIAERYRVVSRLGEGGMGQVYLAEHIRMKRKSAIKIMRPALVGDVEALQRFTREAENASQLSHPNIAAIFDFGETTDGLVYLAMEYIDGDSLAVKLDQEVALHPDVAADILGQAADALQAAHDLNMLHRDIKPDNIMLGKRPDGTFMVKLVDFGIARSMDGSDQKVTRTGFAIGTPQYMSPEQLSGDVLDARSDQYSLALVAFFALTGQQAFPAESTKESLIARLTSRPRTLQDAKQDVNWPQALQDIFDRALAPEPADRFATVSEFAHALAGAISAMTPSQTAALYRRALDVRVASAAALTPHSDIELLRTPSTAVPAMDTPASTTPVRPAAAVTTPGAATPVSSSATTASTSSTPTTPIAVVSTTTVPTRPDVPLTSSTPATASATTPANAAGTPATGIPAETTSVGRPRWPLVAGAVTTLAAAIALFFTQRGTRETGDAASLADSATAAAMAVAASESASDAELRLAAARGEDSSGGVSPNATATSAPTAASTADSTAKSNATRDAQRRRAALAARRTADSLAELRERQLRFPDAAARAMLARGVDAKSRMAKNDDIRAVIMPTPIFVWRAEQAVAFKDAHPRASGERYPLVDPIERWSAWTPLVTSRRALYVLEVISDKVPWPSYEPEKVYDIRRGDVTTVEVLRDGVPIPLDAPSHVPAVVNPADHEAGGKKVPNAFVATLPPTAFNRRDDGSDPKIEVVVHDALRNGAVTRITLNRQLVRRLYDDLAPWRDALVRP